jgi:transcription elongation factor S-II
MDDDLKNVDVIGTQIEEVIFKLTSGEKTQCYRRKVASQIFNLGDNRNPALRYKALTGQLTPSQLARMDAFEMASEQMKEYRYQIMLETTRPHVMLPTISGGGGLEKCPKCKGYNTMNNQVQMLSCDQPMTTFCWCSDCNNRWRF